MVSLFIHIPVEPLLWYKNQDVCMRESKLTMNKKNREIRKMDVWMDGQIDREII